ncbi:MAG: Spy/CpxP family protein refolding chaperone [Bacteroidota bacterium]
MKTRLLVIIALMGISWGAWAQPGEGRRSARQQEMESARIAFLTQKLDLTSEQAQQFWPIYFELEDKRREIRKSLRDTRMEAGAEFSEEEASNMIVAFQDMRQKELTLEKEYSQKMLGVLSARQVVKLLRAEEEFRQYVIQQLRERRGERHERGPRNRGRQDEG